MRLPPIAWAGIVAVVVLGLAIVFGLLTGPGPGPACTTGPGATTSPHVCASPTPTAS